MSRDSKKFQRMMNLMGSFPFRDENNVKVLKHLAPGCAELKTVNKIYDLAEELAVNRVWFEMMWNSIYREQKEEGREFKKRPVRRKTDNFNLYEGEEFRGGGTKRVPKRGRKTAWKRFFKLFPHLKDRNLENKAHIRVY